MLENKQGKELSIMTMYRDTLAGQQAQNQPQGIHGEKRKNWIAATLLCAFLGPLGIHRFYTGYPVIGVVQLLTFGGCCIWTLIDYIMLILNKYKDANGQELEEYNGTLAIVLIVLLVIGVLIGIFTPAGS